MANLTSALAGLVSFGATVSGVAQSYDLKTFFDAKQAGSISYPCLLAVPDLGEQTGWKALGQLGNAPLLDFVFEHYLMFAQVGNTADMTVILPQELALVDNYFTALKTTPFLTAASSPSVHQPPQVSYRMMKSNWYGIQYHSIGFRLAMRLYL
jgi:hypothetical protein